MSSGLDKVRLDVSYPLNISTYTMIAHLGKQSKFKLSITVSNNGIIKSLNWGTSCPMIWIKPTSKQQDKQT